MDDLPPPKQVIEGEVVLPKKDDDALVEIGAKINNPFAKFFNWLKDFIKRNQSVTIKIPLLGLFVAFSSFSLGLGSGYNWGFNQAAATFFPDSSPILHRPISVEGVVQKSTSGNFYLKSEGSKWQLQSDQPNINLTNFINQQVEVKGKLTREKNVIEVLDVIENSQTSLAPQSPGKVESDIPNQDLLPKLYSDIKWEVTQKKILTFTSGRRRIEQEGVYLESAQVSNIPQAFIDYYTTQLTNLGFKQTLNSTDPDGTMITYSKDELFLTFGVKNVYKGSGENKQLVGYKAYLEHN